MNIPATPHHAKACPRPVQLASCPAAPAAPAAPRLGSLAKAARLLLESGFGTLAGAAALVLLLDSTARAQITPPPPPPPPALPTRLSTGTLLGAQTPSTVGAVMTINQTAPRALIEWTSFNIGQGGTVRVAGQAPTSILLNRVSAGTATNGAPSTIDGALQASGRVFILDPNGVVFGANARVNTGGLLAAAMAMTSSDANFIDGTGLTLAGDINRQGAVTVDANAVITGPSLTAEGPTGDVVLLGMSGVAFNGRINATNVFIGAGGSAQVPVGDSGFVTLKLSQAGATSARVTGSQSANGGISAVGGTVDIQTAGLGESSVDWSANIDATGGRITMRGTGSEGDGVRVQAVSNTTPQVQLLARDITLVGTSDFGTGVSLSGVTAVASNSINLGGSSIFSPGVNVTGFSGLSSLSSPNISIIGRSESSGVEIGRGTTLSGDVIDVRGIVVPSSQTDTAQTALVGVDLGGAGDTGVGLALPDVTFVLGQTGRLTVNGRAEAPATLVTSPAFGLLLDRVVVTTPAGGGRSVTFAGEAVNGAGSAAIVTSNSGGAGMVSVRGDTGLSGADVVFGGDAPGNGTAFMTLGGPTSVATQGYATAPALRTTGSVNLRPLGVDINGQVVEKPGRAIQVDSDPTLAVTPFVVPTDWTVDFNFDSIGNIQASRMVIGSQAHQGAIDVGVDALRRDALPLTLQNQGSGSAGVRLQGNTTAPNDLAVLSAGPITQTGVLRVGSLLLQGTGSNSAVLDNSANDITALTFDQLGSLRLTGTSESGLTLQAGQATGFDAAAGAFTPLDISRNSATNTVLIDTDQLTLGSGISMTGANAQLDLVARTAFSSPGAAQIDTSGGGVWRVWAPTWNTQLGALNGASPTPTLFGCVFGDTSTCSVSQVALPASRSGFFFADQPLLVITPTSVSSPRGRPLPTLPFGVSGLVAGNTAAEALTGALGTPATPDSPLGSYPIQPGSLSSPLGYRLAFSSGTGTSDVTPLLTLTRQVDIPVTPFGGTLAQIMSAVSSDTYGRNLAAPTMCMAPGAARRERSVADGLDLLGLEWGRVRLQPQLSSCVDVASDSSCAGF